MPKERIELAAALSRFAHKGQVDKGGKDYYKHPLAVANSFDWENPDEEDCVIVALLHDTLEDTNVSEEVIRNLFGEKILSALLCMTHKAGVPYEEYVMNLKSNPIARKVKISDLRHNMDLSRLPIVTEKDIKRLEKYKKALKILAE